MSIKGNKSLKRITGKKFKTQRRLVQGQGDDVDLDSEKTTEESCSKRLRYEKNSTEDEGVTSSSDDVEEEYEKLPRIKKSVKRKNLLPLKTKTGVVFRSEVVQEDETKHDNDDDASLEIEPKKKVKKNLVQKMAMHRKHLANLKRKIALICTSVVEDPEKNMVALKELVSMLQTPTTKMPISEKKVLCFSLLHVFLDVLPGYRIREQEETNSKVKLKKETKKLLGYEQSLLKSYKKYLDLLYEMVRGVRIKQTDCSSIQKRVSYEIGIIALKCMCELLSTRFSFNFFKNIANKLVPLAISGDEKVSLMCCKAFEKLFMADKLGEASFNMVKQIVDVVKEQNFCVPASVLRTFLCLNLREAKPDTKKVDMDKGRREWQAMSRAQRKDKKKMKELEAELKEAEAYESVENVKKFHTLTLNKIFWVFFHILKNGEMVTLISPALEGLSKFAYLINLEFFDDLNSVLCGMMESGKLNDVEKLHGVYTLFTILAGQAESLHIDPHKIYCHMYEGLLNLGHSTDVDHFTLTLKCLEFNILRKRKRISLSRILAFVKRISSVCLQTPIHGALGLMSSARRIISTVKGSDILLDSESTLGSGLYLPEVPDPEHCNAQSTALWELHLLQKHYNPAIKLYAMHLLNNCTNKGRNALPDKLLKLTPEETLDLFAEVAVSNKMDFLQNVEEPPKKKFKFDHMEALSFEQSVDAELCSDMLDDVSFFA